MVCLLETHTKCNAFMIRVEDIAKGKLEKFENWYDDSVVSQIASMA